ncbi:MAG: ATP-dependent helicase RecG, partial [Variibacter sp.]|nr:ATP-dependent helicase RecG [Variibacter sp.]
MRPSLLNPLFASLASLSGIGPKQERLFARLLGRGEAEARVLDLLFHLPTGALDRRSRPKLIDVVPGELVTVTVRIDQHQAPPPNRRQRPYRIYAHDETGDIIFVFFNVRGDYLKAQFPVGEVRHVSGRVALWDGMRQMTHPDRVVAEHEMDKLPAVEAVYPLTEGLGLRHAQKAIGSALDALPNLPEWQESNWLGQQAWPDFGAALRSLHMPEQPADVLPDAKAWQRLAYDELLAGQLALMLVRAHMRRPRGHSHVSQGKLRARIEAALPYALTQSQRQALAEISADLRAPERMLRLLQGDVGSGKTIVALLAAAEVIESGRQAALMAPTELLARQHYATISTIAENAGIACALVTGREKGRERAQLETRLAQGEIEFVVGTHALFQTGTAFRDLGLAIVDEQHRFGVQQRLALANKGDGVDMLVLTATPIPRTLVLTYFGDMDVSQLREKPPGRQPIDTRTIPLSRFDEVVDAVGRAISEGQRVYWVCPLVSESETEDLAAAEDRFALLKERFGAHVGLVHGRMKGADKDAAMASFADGAT